MTIKVKLVPMSIRDLELVMAWRSHPDAYQYFQAQNGPLVWSEHLRFWNSRTNRKDYIITVYEDGIWRKVGNLNLTLLNTNTPEIGIIIGELTAHNRGIGSKAVALGLQELKKLGFTQTTVVIHESNTASIKLFEKFHFVKGTKQNASPYKKYYLESLSL